MRLGGTGGGLSKSKIIAALGILAVVAATTAGGFYYKHITELREMERVFALETIYPGVTINGVNVSGKTKDEAFEILNEQFERKIDEQKIIIKNGDRQWEINFPDVDAKYNVADAVDDAYDCGRSGEGKERYNEIKRIAAEGEALEMNYSYDGAKVDAELERVKNELNIEPQDSVLTRENGTFTATEEKVGYTLDMDSAKRSVIEMLEGEEGGEFEAVVQETLPKLTREEALKATDLIGSFSTAYSGGAGNAGRNENLRLGCLNINGTVLKPGDVFSANVGLGPQTLDAGYKMAAVYANGKVEQDVAGGVCQVTTTLYNAVIFSELEIVERHGHSLTVGYVPLGRDAAVAGTYKDLKFKNNTEYPVYIEMYLSNGNVVANIFGHEIHNPGRKLEFETVYNGSIQKPAEKVTKNPNLPEGQRVVKSAGKVGHSVSVYKNIYENGALESRKHFADTTYIATADEVEIGTGAAVKKPEPAPAQPNTEAPAPAPAEPEQPAEPPVVDVGTEDAPV